MSTKIIEAYNLKKAFKHKIAIYNLNISLNQGDICGFLGPNGSGKTISLRMLSGLLMPDSGHGRCFGYDLFLEHDKVRINVGYMPQKFSLYRKLTIFENLDFYSKIYRIANRKRRLTEVIDQFGLGERVNQLPLVLSGGWRQRLALAVSVLHEPGLLLLDEPTAGVDPNSRQIILSEIQRLARKGVTILISTHYMDEAERCNKLIYLSDGRVLAKGARDEIINEVGLYTCHIHCKNTNLVYEIFHKLEGISIDQVIQLGDHIRLSDKKIERIEECLKIIKKNDLEIDKCEMVETDLQDCFIYLSRLHINR